MNDSARNPERIGPLRWIPLAAPPLAFLVTLGTQYILGTLPCDVHDEWRGVSLIIPAIPLALAVWMVLMSVSRLARVREHGGAARNGGPTPIDRSTLFVALFCATSSIALWLPPLLLSCR